VDKRGGGAKQMDRLDDRVKASSSGDPEGNRELSCAAVASFGEENGL
jgi:hypothetical protein